MISRDELLHREGDLVIEVTDLWKTENGGPLFRRKAIELP